MTAGMAFSLVSAFADTNALTRVTTAKREVGVMVDVTPSQVAPLAEAMWSAHVQVSFAIDHVTPDAAYFAATFGDEAFPRLPDGGLFQWVHTKPELRRMAHELGWSRHFLYASSGPSLGQWLFAHGDGGTLVGGAVRITGDPKVKLSHLHAGEVIELRVASLRTTLGLLRRLDTALQGEHLSAVPVTRLLHDSGTPVEAGRAAATHRRGFGSDMVLSWSFR